MIGLTRGIVRLVPYETQWNTVYEYEKAVLGEILTDRAADIQHIGSTAIPGICAKPIIDMLVGLRDLAEFPNLVGRVEENGYIYRPDPENRERFLCVKGSENYRTHHIHFVQWNGREWQRLIFFRDYLRAHPDLAGDYRRLKMALAEKYPDDRAAYTEGKSGFIHNVLAKMRE
jgi:GrpB-like predicted nucleotidyltransferase (UPF0157 family)